jgi:hypothetical protein
VSARWEDGLAPPVRIGVDPDFTAGGRTAIAVLLPGAIRVRLRRFRQPATPSDIAEEVVKIAMADDIRGAPLHITVDANGAGAVVLDMLRRQLGDAVVVGIEGVSYAEALIHVAQVTK